MLSATALIGLFFGFKFLISIFDLSLTIFPFHLLGLKGLIGEMDKLVSEKKIDEMIAMFGSAQLKKMEGVAHFPFFEDPKVLNESLGDVFSTYI